MTTENDVYEILFQYKRIQPCTIRTLLEKRDNYIGSHGRVLDVLIIRALKKLEEKGRATKPEVIKHQSWYSITKKGMKDAAIEISYEKMKGKQPQKVFEILLPEVLKPTIGEKNPKNVSDRRTINTLNDITPEGTAPADAAFYLDPGNKDKLETAGNFLANDLFLRNTAYQFVTECQRAILKATENVYKWDGYRSGPPQIRKMVERLKKSLDFDAILSLHFDGKRLVEEYDWESDIKKYEETVKVEHDTWPSFVSGTSKMGTARESWIDFCISEKLNQVKHDLEVLNTLNQVVAADTSSLINQFAEYIVALKETGKILHKGPIPPTVEDAKKHIVEMLDDGTLEIAVTFKVNTQKTIKRQKDATNMVFQETGYTLP